jgi:putative pyruvate formate lyase activating enzyme
MKLTDAYFPYSFPAELADCACCPRECHADRTAGPGGYCKSDAFPGISSICLHKGEEPVIGGETGICNVFFGRCNLQCVYCQNCQISSRTEAIHIEYQRIDSIVQALSKLLDEGCKAVGFVSPSHMVPQMLAIINALNDSGRKPVIVYNSNGYDSVETLKRLEGIVDVYLPDLKYMDSRLAKEYSDAGNYVPVARKALREMFRQKGTALITDDAGQAVSGLIIRHLVLPGNVENSMNVLRFIAEELSPGIHISLMSQYFPMPVVAGHPLLGRALSEMEYKQVVEEMEALGLFKGWIQELGSSGSYLPDFCFEHPFEKY